MSSVRAPLTQRLWTGARHVREQVQEFMAASALDPLPLRQTLRRYDRAAFLGDVKAAINVALLGFPQSMAYAVVAGLPVHYGVTCSAVAGLVAPLLSSSRHTVIGPSNATAFMVFSYFAAYPYLDRLQLMPLLVFITAALLILGAYLRVADLVQYISRTVVVAYVTGAAVLIMVNQLSSVLGVTLSLATDDDSRHRPVTLPGVVYRVVMKLGETQWSSVMWAAITLLCYLLIKRVRPKWPAFAITLAGVSLLAAGVARFGLETATYADAAFSWYQLLPPFPDFASSSTLANASRLFGLAVALAFLSTLETSVMSKTLASRGNYRTDPNQDMLGLGVSNLACTYLSGMPCSGSPVRSTLNFTSGARTPLASMMSGLLCLIGAFTLGGLVGYIPRACLAMLVIIIAVSLINRRNIRICMKATRSDAVVFIITLGAALMVPLHVAIFTGVGVSIVLYIRKASRPSLVEYEFNQEGNLAEAARGVRQNPSISIVHVEGDLFFGAAELFRTQIQRTCADPNLRIIILRLKNARHLDATSVMALEELIRVLRADGRDLIVSGAMKDVYRVLRDAGLVEVIGKQNIFPGSPTNPNISTRNALKRAQQILGDTQADVRIYYDPNQGKTAAS